MTHISWSRDFVSYLKVYLIVECHTLGSMRQCNVMTDVDVEIDVSHSDLYFMVQ